MSNSRRLRRGVGATDGRQTLHVARTPDEAKRCPHCGAGLDEGFDMMWTLAEFKECAACHGVDLVPGMESEPLARSAFAWWFCHRCLEGGAMGRVP